MNATRSRPRSLDDCDANEIGRSQKPFDNIHPRGFAALCKTLIGIHPRLPSHIKGVVSLGLRDLLHVLYGINHSPADLSTAATVGESILSLMEYTPLLSENQHIRELDQSCFKSTSHFIATGQNTSLDTAVALAEEAWSESAALRPVDDGKYSVLTKIGYALNTQGQYAATSERRFDEKALHKRLGLDLNVQTSAPKHNLIQRVRAQSANKADSEGLLVAVAQGILDATLDGHPARAPALFLLCQTLSDRFYQTGFWKDLDEAIRLSKLTPSPQSKPDDFHRPILMIQTQLSMQRYKKTKDLQDLQDIIESSRQLIWATPQNHELKGSRIYFHVHQLKRMALCISDLRRLDLIVQEALHESAPSSPASMVSRIVLDILSRRYELSANPTHLHETVFRMTLIPSGVFVTTPPGGLSIASADAKILKELLPKLKRLAAEPLEHSIVAQVSGAFHKEYIKPGRLSDPVKRVIQIQNDGVINAEIVSCIYQNSDWDLIRKEQMAMIEFCFEIGAKTYQMRMKMMDLTIRPGDKKPSDPIADAENDRLLANKKIDLEKRFDAARKKFKRSGSILDLDRAVEIGTALSTQADALASDRFIHLNTMVDLLYTAYQITQSPERLHLALENAKEFVKLVAANGAGRFQDPVTLVSDINILSGLAHDLSFHARQCSRLSEFDDAIEIAKAAANHSDSSAEFLTIDLHSSMTPSSGRGVAEYEEDIIKHCQARFVLAICLKSKYQYGGGTMDDIEQAIDTLRTAIKLSLMVYAGRRQNHTVMVSRLGLMLRLRYQERGNLRDLEEAMELMEDELLEMTQRRRDGDDMFSDIYSELVNNLGLIALTKNDRTGRLEDCQKAVKYTSMAVKTSKHHPIGYIASLINCASALLDSYTMTKVDADLDKALGNAFIATSVMKPEATNPIQLSDASAVFLAGFHHRNKPHMLELAIKYSQQAVDTLPENSLSRGPMLGTLGRVLETAQRHQPSRELAERLLSAHLETWSIQSGQFRTRIEAGRKAVKILVDTGRQTEAKRILAEACDMMTKMTPWYMTSQDRQYIISLFAGMSNDAAAAHIHLSLKPNCQDAIYDALRCLEGARGIILGSIMDHRAEVKELEMVAPNLCREFNQTCLELDALANERSSEKDSSTRKELTRQLKDVISQIRQIPELDDFTPPLALGSLVGYTLEKSAPRLFKSFNSLQRSLDALPEVGSDKLIQRRQQELTAKIESLVPQIRRLPGLENFLLPLDLPSTLELAKDAVIVIVNTSTAFQRSDAIIVRTSGLHCLRLSNLDPYEALSRSNGIPEMTSGWSLRSFGAKNEQMVQHLDWLWRSIVHPVLDHLEYSQSDQAKKPHIHWIGTGPLSGAAFHAAGDYKNRDGKGTMDYVVSSYSPTLRALSYARQALQNKRYKFQNNTRFLLVSAPDVPGTTSLTSVPAEVLAVSTIAEHKTNVVKLEDGTSDAVLKELPLANIVHFACHGVSDASDLDNSHLILNSTLQNGSTALTVRQIRAHKSPSAELVYLSVCSAADNSTAYMADEAIHLSSAFQASGFAHVVGTLWRTKDEACKEIAVEFYKSLFEAVKPGELPVADALHTAVGKLRMKYWKKPLVWAPFVHFGG